MPSFSALLISGTKRPYDSWTFVVVPDHVVVELGSKRASVRGTIKGVGFRGTVSRGEGMYRMPVPRELQKQAKIARGDRVRVFMEVDAEPRPIDIPRELEEVFSSNPDLAKRFQGLPPAHRRAWAAHIADAKRAETRIRRAAKAAAGIRNKSFPGA
ncbi:MAG: DUF1905 domain-containing protein [Phycisphaerae bacterium]|nr:DUF1905 domain-containing protein [Phycisphaerae bacterium]